MTDSDERNTDHGNHRRAEADSRGTGAGSGRHSLYTPGEGTPVPPKPGCTCDTCTGSREGPRLIPHEEEPLPLLGFRMSNLFLNDRTHRLEFGAANLHFGRWPVEATATCKRLYKAPGKHLSPDLNCSCGFYAVATRVDLWRHSYLGVVSTVEMRGRVVEHEHGYRAQIQRLLSVELSRCFRCDGIPDRLVFTSEPVDYTTPDWWMHHLYGGTKCSNHRPMPFSKTLDIATAFGQVGVAYTFRDPGVEGP